MFRSRKDDNTKNLNRVVIQVGAHQMNKDLLDFTIYAGDTEYTVEQLFEKIIQLEDQNKKLRKALRKHERANNNNSMLLTKATELLSAKMAAVEDEISTLKNKTKYL